MGRTGAGGTGEWDRNRRDLGMRPGKTEPRNGIGTGGPENGTGTGGTGEWNRDRLYQGIGSGQTGPEAENSIGTCGMGIGKGVRLPLGQTTDETGE